MNKIGLKKRRDTFELTITENVRKISFPEILINLERSLI